MAVLSRLVQTSIPKHPEGVVLVLHGGATREGSPPVSSMQLSVLRMVPVARQIARAGSSRLAVFRLLNSARGWSARPTPLDDVRWALDELRDRLGVLPTGLVGHSLGGRAALLSAGQPEISSIVALNPWVYADDGNIDAAGRKILIVHGTDDRIADPERSTSVARTMGRTADVGYVRVTGGKHAMLGRHGTFDRLAANFMVTSLLDAQPSATIERVLQGEQWLDV